MSTPPCLDAPLPDALTGRHHGWFTEYRRYPVFSTPWVRGRWRSLGLVLALLALSLVGTVLVSEGGTTRPWPGVTEMLLTWFAPALAGPLLGRWVRQRGWPQRQEGWALAGAIATVVLGVAAFTLVVAEPMKQFIAEQTGNVDANGKRKRVVMMIGMSISSPDDSNRAPPGDPLADPVTAALNHGTRALTSFLLAGGLALRGWRRERAGLAQLAQERALAEAQAQRREAELRLSVLAAQVEPHFLFNTLAGVRSAIATDPARASEMIDRLVEYLRAAIPRLRSDGSAQATVGAQFDIVRAYLALMAARMPRLQFEVAAAEPALLQARCPPLMLISLAENAVKHGVEMKIGPAHIAVRAERSDDGRLLLTVEDDGVGFGVSSAGSGLGLTNIRERLAQLHGDRAALALKARRDGGVAATITVPLEFDTAP